MTKINAVILRIRASLRVLSSDFGFLSDFGFRSSDLATVVLFGLSLIGLHAQPPNTPSAPKPQDPLISMMLAQPRIDVESPVVPSASFDPPEVKPGEESIYRVSFNALEESVEMPDKISAPDGLDMRSSAHGQALQQMGPVLQPRTTFNFRVRASNLGEFTIPQFTVKVTDKPPVTVPAAKLSVVASPSAPPAAQLFLEISDTNLFLGQTVKVRMLSPSPSSGGIQMLIPNTAQFTGDGFVVDQGAIQQRVEGPPPGMPGPVYIHETLLTPLNSGKLSVFAQAFVPSHTRGPIVIQGSGALTFGPAPYVLVESPPQELNVRPLPRQGELPGFTGAVGVFAVDTPVLTTNSLQVGEPVKMTVTVRSKHGEASLARLVAPPTPRAKEWQIFAGPAEIAPPQAVQARGFAVFTYTLIALTETAQATPAIPFSSFDPAGSNYVDLTIPSVPVKVSPGHAPGDWQAISQAAPGESDEEKEPELNGLAPAPGRTALSLVPWQRQTWFPLVQLAPAALFAGLWGWDRRRRYLEEHPDVVLRRRARRALRRERRLLKEAAQSQDGSRFAAAAVNAMRIACAPHFPAEPRALVGTDVLQLLHQSNGHDVPDDLVRRFFNVADASRFALTPSDTRELLALKPGLERVLEKLEERL
jgi:hypothetical protein